MMERTQRDSKTKYLHQNWAIITLTGTILVTVPVIAVISKYITLYKVNKPSKEEEEELMMVSEVPIGRVGCRKRRRGKKNKFWQWFS